MLATVSELGDWLGETIAAGSVDEKRAILCLRLASALVREETGKEWVDGGALVDPLPEAIRLVTLYCASRVFENRVAQTRGGIDDFQEGWKVDEAGAYLTASERGMLAKHRTRSLGIGTIATTRTDAPTASGLVPTGTPGVEFPWY